MDDAVRRRLVERDWPGNVSELRNYAFEAVLGLADMHGRHDRLSGERVSLAQRVERFEAMAVREALETAREDIALTMDLLGLPRKTLYDKLTRHGIDPKRYRPGLRT